MSTLDKLRESRSAKRAELDAILNDDNATDEQLTRGDQLVAELSTIDARISGLADLEAREQAAAEVRVDSEDRSHTPITVTREERTYGPGRRANFFADVVGAQLLNDYTAQQRLASHMNEERVERGSALTGVQNRDVGTSAFAGLTVPQFLTDLVAPPKRPMRPLADIARKFSLPADGMVISLSRGTTGTAAAVQATQNSAVQETDYDDTQLDVNVVTVSGQQDMSVQAVQRSTGSEQLILSDLIADYHTKLDYQLINGSGSSGEHRGILNVSGIVSVTYTDASPTAAEAYPKLFDVIAQIQSAVYGGATHFVMAPRRWQWFASQVGSSFPFIQPNNVGSVNVGGEATSNTYGGVVGTLAGLPVVLDGNILTNSGAGTNQDTILAVTADELLLWEEDGAPMLIRAEQTGAGNLSVKLVVYGFSAFTAGRYPSAHGTITGTGLVTPTF